MAHVSKEIWEAHVKGWNVVDCAVRSKDVISLCMREDTPEEQASRMWDHDIPSRLINLFINRSENIFGHRTYSGLNKPRVGVCVHPVAQAMMVARNNDGQVVLLGGGKDFPDEFIDPGKVPMTYRIKTIDGYAYSVGGQRKIYKRTDIGTWTHIGNWPRSEHVEQVGFNDMDAFADNDMYAVGGHGDVWHFDGSTWTQMGFPSNVQLATVTCAGDGNVYISGEGGSLWMGRRSTWKPIYQGASSILWNDVLWFDDRLWLASDYQLRVWNGSALEPVLEAGEAVPISGHMDARDGLLVVAGPWSVMSYDGKQWRFIVAPYHE